MSSQNSRSFFDKSPAGRAARSAYLKTFIGGTVLTIIAIFSIFVIFWNALAKSPARNLPGWIVDFDGGLIGQAVINGSRSQPASQITWTVVSATQFPGGVQDLSRAVMEEGTWVAVAINEGSTARLTSSLASPNASYNGADVITVFAVEARNENAYGEIILPSLQPFLDTVSRSFARQNAELLSSFASLSSILSISPQTIVEPVYYTIDNLAPFYAVPVAEAVVFVGLIYQIIISFFIVIVGTNARMASGLEKTLSTRSLIALRLVSMFCCSFAISLFYSLLSLAFKLDVSRKFGHSGFLVFWMLNYCGMLAVGLALESLSTLLTRFMPFFLITWIITNISVCILPIQSMPVLYRYGYAAPLYNISRAMRTIIFGTKNAVGLSFGVILVWIAISCMTLPLIQWYVRREPRRPPVANLKAQSDASLNSHASV